jgi:hypothetical protein
LLSSDWDVEWHALGYLRVLGVIRDLTGDWSFLHVEKEDGGGGNGRDRDRGRNTGRDRESEKRRILNSRRSNSNSSDDNNEDEESEDGDVRIINQRGHSSHNSWCSDDDTATNSADRELDKKERKEAVNLSVEIIFASHTSISPFPKSLCGARYMQLACLSNLLNSPNLKEFKQKMVPIIIDLMADSDMRNRLLVARYGTCCVVLCCVVRCVAL